MGIINSSLIFFMFLLSAFSNSNQQYISGDKAKGFLKIVNYLLVIVVLFTFVNIFILSPDGIGEELSVRVMFTSGFLASLFRAVLVIINKHLKSSN